MTQKEIRNNVVNIKKEKVINDKFDCDLCGKQYQLAQKINVLSHLYVKEQEI